MVQDHRTAVIGGLLASQTDIQRSAIPFISDIPVIGNLFSDNGSNKQKDNLLVFLTPHVVRTREDLRSLALDERQKFTDALGRKEMHHMPMDQYKQLYQPTFSVPVSPAQDLKDRGSTRLPSSGGGFGGGFGSSSSSMTAPAPSSSTPFNTEEIGPTTSRGAVKPAPWMTAPPSSPATASPSTIGSTLPAAPSAAIAAAPAAAGAADAP